jgi:hypothetical protein
MGLACRHHMQHYTAATGDLVWTVLANFCRSPEVQQHAVSIRKPCTLAAGPVMRTLQIGPSRPTCSSPPPPVPIRYGRISSSTWNHSRQRLPRETGTYKNTAKDGRP